MLEGSTRGYRRQLPLLEGGEMDKLDYNGT